MKQRYHFLNKTIKALRPYLKPLLIVLAIYCVAMTAIWRANFSYMDDLGRAITGYAWTSDFNRYSSSILASILNVSFGSGALADISPWSQIVAMLFLSISSIIITYVFCDRRIKTIPLILSTFIGLTPFAIGCWVFKFDAPCMALSILASVIPFLLWSHYQNCFDKKRIFILGLVTLACLMIMWTSYQASSGIFLLMILGLALKSLLDKEKNTNVLRKLSMFFIPYVASALIFKFCLPIPAGYRQLKTVGALDLPSGIFMNVKNLVRSILDSLNNEWAALLVITILTFIVSLAIFSKRRGWKRVIDPVLGLVFLLIGVPLSYGAYLILETAPVNGRSLIGIGVLLAIACIIMSKSIHGQLMQLITLPSIVLLYSFIVFALAFGNGLSDQERYGSFRTEVLSNDLSHIYSDQQTGAYRIQIQGDIGEAAVMKHVHSLYPVVEKVFDYHSHGLAYSRWGTIKTIEYYGLPQELLGVWEQQLNCSDAHLELDTYYHTISTNDSGTICVVVK